MDMIKNDFTINEDALFDLYIDQSVSRFSKPYRQNEYVCATEGHRMIRIREDYIQNNYDPNDKLTFKFPSENCNYTIPLDKLESSLSNIPQITEYAKELCPECGGSGTVIWEYTGKRHIKYEQEDGCPVCCGFGYLKKEKTGKKIPDLDSSISLVKSNLKAEQIKCLVDTMKLLGLDQIFLLFQNDEMNIFQLKDGIDVVIMNYLKLPDFELKL